MCRAVWSEPLTTSPPVHIPLCLCVCERRDSTGLLWVGISRGSEGTYSWTDGRTINGAWTGKIAPDADVQGQGCVAVDTADAADNNDVSLALKDCSASQLSYLCMVDTGELLNQEAACIVLSVA